MHGELMAMARRAKFWGGIVFSISPGHKASLNLSGVDWGDWGIMEWLYGVVAHHYYCTCYFVPIERVLLAA